MVRRFAEARRLLRFHRNVRRRVREHLENLAADARTIENALGEPLRGKEVLEIGPGQLLKQARRGTCSRTRSIGRSSGARTLGSSPARMRGSPLRGASRRSPTPKDGSVDVCTTGAA